MSEENQDPNPDPNAAQSTPDPNATPAPDANAGQGNDAVDGEGVPYKNRAAEAQRKLDQKTEEYEEMQLRLQTLENKVAQPVQPQPAANQPRTKQDMDEMIALGPKAYTEKVQKEIQHKQNMASAENLIKESFGAGRLQFGVAKVLDYAEKNMINIAANPERAVKKILSEMNKPKAKPLSDDDKKKAADALKNKPISGKQTPAPPVTGNNKVQENLETRGSIEDGAAWLQNRFKKE